VTKSNQLDFFKPSSAQKNREARNSGHKVRMTGDDGRNARRALRDPERGARDPERGARRSRAQTDSEFAPGKIAYGGDPADRSSRRKVKRPLSRKHPVHLVMKSTHAQGAMSFLARKNFLPIAKIIDSRARDFGVKIHRREIMSNHIHIVASFKNRVAFQNFLRTATALIARSVTGARKGKPFQPRRTKRLPPSARVRFFDNVVFSRVINGFRDFNGVKRYLRKNEAERELGYQARRLIEQFERAARESIHKHIKLWSRLESDA
jgi:REP element-mobilizing transposase RayT